MSEPGTNRPEATEDFSTEKWLGSNHDPDVLLSVPDLGVEKIVMSVDDLVADVDLQARVLDIVELHVGAHVTLAKVELDIEKVRARLMLKVRLDQITDVVHRVMQSIDNNPDLIPTVTAPVVGRIRRAGIRAREHLRDTGRRLSSSDPRQVEAVHDVEYDARLAPERPDGQNLRPGDVHTALVDGQ